MIDVREIDELKRGIIEDSVHIHLWWAICNAKKQIEDMRDKICTYCSSRYHGNIASDELTRMVLRNYT
ncbi:rhodanese-like domain-containing protein [Nitrosarchaeum sp.]|uniref:rhodanese-like domain-containing protein n=1 Tax=Nitrosarchaeum sp. TaxID=2026886 RepID=UPI002E147530